MALDEPNGAPAAGFGMTASAMECAVSAINAASKNLQAVAGECFEMSKQSFEHASQTWEKLRSAKGMDDVVTIQRNFVNEAIENASEHARKFGELWAAFPTEITRTYQDAWLKSVNAAIQAMQSASKTAPGTGTSYSEGVRKPQPVYEHRESA
jgi:hypothetical protein